MAVRRILLAVDHQRIAFDGDVALEAAVHRIVLQHVRQVVGLEQIVDGDDFNVWKILHRRAEHHSSDAAKSIDTDLDCHVLNSLDKERTRGGADYLRRVGLVRLIRIK